MRRSALWCLVLVLGCGAKTGFADDDDLRAGSTDEPEGTLPGKAGGEGGEGGFVCPGEAPRAGSACVSSPGSIERCGPYDRAHRSDRVPGMNAYCPVNAACADGIWHTIDCQRARRP